MTTQGEAEPMPDYMVGELFNPQRTSYEDGDYLAIDNQVMLTITMSSPTPAEVQQFRTGKARFGWVDSEHVGMLCLQLGLLPWADAPFTPHLCRTPPSPPAAYRTGRQQIVTLVLVDGATGIIHAMRGVSWPSRFVDAVGATVTRMLASPPSLVSHDAAIATLYARYPRPVDLVRQRADITCTGGTSEVAFGTGPDASPR
ncbi:hypothetical protein [Tessaracoccus sp.]